jgi:plastocyanin
MFRIGASFPRSDERSHERVFRCATGIVVGMVAWLMVAAAGWAETHHVRIDDNTFEPPFLTIAPGDTVIWTDFGSDHTVTAVDEAFNVFMEFGATFSFTFDTIGVYPYFCSIHSVPGGEMSGAIRVADFANNQPPAQPVNGLPVPGATFISLSPTLTASAYSDPDPDDTHIASQWLVRILPSSELVVDSGESAQNRTSLGLTGLSNGATYSWQVRYKDDRGGWSEYSVATEFTTVPPPQGEGTGLLATYGAYNRKRDVFVSKDTQTDAVIDFDWGVKRATKRTPSDNFLVRWEGTVVPEYSERYRFRIRADGGVRVWIGGQLIVEDWVNWKYPIHRNGTAEMQAGVPTAIKIEYFDTTGRASCNLRWSSPSQPLQLVPTAKLFPPSAP